MLTCEVKSKAVLASDFERPIRQGFVTKCNSGESLDGANFEKFPKAFIQLGFEPSQIESIVEIFRSENA